MTTYDIFMHYYNDRIGKAVTNLTDCKWYSCLTTPSQYREFDDEEQPIVYNHTYLQNQDMDQEKLDKNQETLEVLYIYYDTKEHSDSTNNPDINAAKYEELIVQSSSIFNPKYDMIFIWDGLGYYTDDNEQTNQLYFDKMKRVNFRPWFFHSMYHSLKAALSKAETLINLFGKDHIMIGKEVDLTQYIDII